MANDSNVDGVYPALGGLSRQTSLERTGDRHLRAGAGRLRLSSVPRLLGLDCHSALTVAPAATSLLQLERLGSLGRFRVQAQREILWATTVFEHRIDDF